MVPEYGAWVDTMFIGDDLRRAALDNLWPIPQFNETFPEDEAALQRGEKWVAEKRAWVKTLTDKRVAEAYDGWLRHVESGIARNRKENLTHAREKEHQQWESRTDEESRRSAELAKTLPKPPR